LFSFVNLFFKKKIRKRNKESKHIQNEKLLVAEKRITKSIIIYIGGFMLTWTPYTFVFLFNSFKKNTNNIDPVLSTVSAVFAKSSVVWSTLFYILSNKTIKSKLFEQSKIKSISVQYTNYRSKSLKIRKKTKQIETSKNGSNRKRSGTI